MKKRSKIIISWAAVALMAAVIFCFSAQPSNQSAEISLGVKSWIAHLFQSAGLLRAAQSAKLHSIIRKTAHFILYFVFGLLAANAFYQSMGEKKKTARLSLLMSVLYAASDEVHQCFVPGRGPGVGDVVLDSVAAMCGIVVFLLIVYMYMKKKRN